MDINQTFLIDAVVEVVLTKTANKPFFCLPMSAVLYAVLKDSYKINAKIVTGNLTYKEHFIFKQDFSISESDNGTFKRWAGHAWVEIDGTIWDLSFFRTLYSSEFKKPYKDELLKLWGTNQDIIVTNSAEIPDKHMRYYPIDILSDEMATGIIKGMDQIP